MEQFTNNIHVKFDSVDEQKFEGWFRTLSMQKQPLNYLGCMSLNLVCTTLNTQ